MGMKRYASAGFVIDSAYELEGLATQDAANGTADLSFTETHEEPSHAGEALEIGPNWTFDGETFILAVPDVAKFHITRDGKVSVRPTGGSHNDIAAFLIGSVLGIALHLRGVITLHASAVAVEGGAALFCGASGAGKSTMAAALKRRGHHVLCDDLCGVELSSKGAIMHPDGRKLKLWASAIEVLDLGERQGGQVREGFEKYFIEADDPLSESMPIKALYGLVDPRNNEEPCITPLALADAAALVRRNAYRPLLVRKLNEEGLYFKAAATLLRQAKVHRLERNLNLKKIDGVVDALEAHWHDVGLA